MKKNNCCIIIEPTYLTGEMIKNLNLSIEDLQLKSNVKTFFYYCPDSVAEQLSEINVDKYSFFRINTENKKTAIKNLIDSFDTALYLIDWDKREYVEFILGHKSPKYWFYSNTLLLERVHICID